MFITAPPTAGLCPWSYGLNVYYELSPEDDSIGKPQTWRRTAQVPRPSASLLRAVDELRIQLEGALAQSHGILPAAEEPERLPKDRLLPGQLHSSPGTQRRCSAGSTSNCPHMSGKLKLT